MMKVKYPVRKITWHTSQILSRKDRLLNLNTYLVLIRSSYAQFDTNFFKIINVYISWWLADNLGVEYHVFNLMRIHRLRLWRRRCWRRWFNGCLAFTSRFFLQWFICLPLLPILQREWGGDDGTCLYWHTTCCVADVLKLTGSYDTV